MTRSRKDDGLAFRPLILCPLLAALLVIPAGATMLEGAPSATASVRAAVTVSGQPYPCAPHGDQGIEGAYSDAGAIGWQGNGQGVVACLGGSFYVQDGINHTFGYGIYDDSRTTWSNADGYLPALVTSFRRGGLGVSITNFADQVVLGGSPYVAVYSRVAIHNPTRHAARADPEASPGLIPLELGSAVVPPGRTVDHDFVIAVDRFGQASPWPTADALASAGGFAAHFAHMRDFWNARLGAIAQIHLPDHRLEDAYRSGFIYTQIARSGDQLNTGVNGYESEFSHDVVGILANLFTQGDYGDAHALLLEARHAVGTGEYEDGLWTYSWPWAIYLLKTGDVDFVRANFSTEGPGGPTAPSLEDAAHRIALDRSPLGIMRRTDDVDANGSWTVDNYEALMGLAAYRYLAQRVGDPTEAAWASTEYDGLLAATNRTLQATISHDHLPYLPCSMLEPNVDNRCLVVDDANWAAPFLFGRWAWDGSLFGASITGPGVNLIDSTYTYGFRQLRGKLPPDTFGGYPDRYFYSTGYNAGYGSWGLASAHFRDQGIRSYQFMIDRTQSGPLSWWESNSAPNPKSPWVGSHPTLGQGSSPHAWGIANANKVLLDSLVAQRSDGSLIIGRGIPTRWTRTGPPIEVSGFPGADGRRLAVTIRVHDRTVVVTVAGAPSSPILLQLPAFLGNLRHSSVGVADRRTGTVTLPPGTRHATVELVHAE